MQQIMSKCGFGTIGCFRRVQNLNASGSIGDLPFSKRDKVTERTGWNAVLKAVLSWDPDAVSSTTTFGKAMSWMVQT
jgi:hypothetical protein